MIFNQSNEKDLISKYGVSILDKEELNNFINVGKYVIKNRYYFSFTIDHYTSSVVLTSSVLNKESEVGEISIKEIVNPLIGLAIFQIRRMSEKLNIPKEHIKQTVDIISNLYTLFIQKYCLKLEFILLDTGKSNSLFVTDTKLELDPKAHAIERKLFEEETLVNYNTKVDNVDTNSKLEHIILNGNIACMTNGVGLAMLTLDIIKEFEGEVACFIDFGSSATIESVVKAIEIILDDKRVEGIFINFFCGKVKSDVIAKGVIKAVNKFHYKLPPLVIRLEGTNSDIAKKILLEENLNVNLTVVNTIKEGAEKIVSLIK
jgi:succinyl-CoA synthetase beta subunit